MLYFTKYAEEKFNILNNHKVFITREQVEDAVNHPDKTEKKSSFCVAVKEGVAVIYGQEKNIKRILTFYPTK